MSDLKVCATEARKFLERLVRGEAVDGRVTFDSLLQSDPECSGAIFWWATRLSSLPPGRVESPTWLWTNLLKRTLPAS
jgi:hypothetical protein